MANDRTFSVPAPPKRALVTLVALLAVAALIGPALLLFEPDGGRGLWIAAMVSTVIPISLFVVLMWALRRRTIALAGGVLDIRAAFYSHRVPLLELDLASARIVAVAEHSELRPLIKTNGFALPGYYAGHFRSRRWKKILALVTADRAVAVEEKAGTMLLLSPGQPQALLDQLSRDAQPIAAARHRDR